MCGDGVAWNFEGESIVTYHRLAYGRVSTPKAGKLIDVGSNVGLKIVQIVYVRPIGWGYKKGSK